MFPGRGGFACNVDKVCVDKTTQEIGFILLLSRNFSTFADVRHNHRVHVSIAPTSSQRWRMGVSRAKLWADRSSAGNFSRLIVELFWRRRIRTEAGRKDLHGGTFIETIKIQCLGSCSVPSALLGAQFAESSATVSFVLREKCTEARGSTCFVQQNNILLCRDLVSKNVLE